MKNMFKADKYLIIFLPFYINHNSSPLKWIEQKGMTFDYDFGYSFPLFSSLLKIKKCLSARSFKLYNRENAIK